MAPTPRAEPPSAEAPLLGSGPDAPSAAAPPGAYDWREDLKADHAGGAEAKADADGADHATVKEEHAPATKEAAARRRGAARRVGAAVPHHRGRACRTDARQADQKL